MDSTDIMSANQNEDANDIMQMLRMTAMTVNSQSQQMGLVVSKIGDHDLAIESLKNDIVAINQSKRVERNQALRLKKAILSRVSYLLGIKYDGGRVADESIYNDKHYRAGFISRAYHDARSFSKLGSPYTETLKVDFDEVLKYISAWEPEVEGGVDGYKQYLDLRRSMRDKRDE